MGGEVYGRIQQGMMVRYGQRCSFNDSENSRGRVGNRTEAKEGSVTMEEEWKRGREHLLDRYCR